MESNSLQIRQRPRKAPQYEMDFLHESDRLQSFELWPCAKKISAQELARAGFYYLGWETPDHVRWAFCNIDIILWEEGDDSVLQHRVFHQIV